MDTKQSLLWVLVLMLAAGPAMAGKKIEYSFGELGYQRQDSDAIVQQGVGVNIWGAVHDYLHLRFGYQRGFIDKLDKQNASGDNDEFSFGAGGNYSVHKKVDIVVGAVAVYDVERFTGTTTRKKTEEWGYRADVGIRAKPHKKLEINGGYLRDDVRGGRNGGFIGGVLDVTKKLSATLKGTFLDKDDEWRIFAGGRLNF